MKSLTNRKKAVLTNRKKAVMLNILNKYESINTECPLWGYLYINNQLFKMEENYDLLVSGDVDEIGDRDSEERNIENILRKLHAKKENSAFFFHNRHK